MAQDPSKLTAKQIEKIREAHSTKATMGQGKPPSPREIAKKLIRGFKKKTKGIKKDEANRRKQLKGK